MPKIAVPVAVGFSEPPKNAVRSVGVVHHLVAVLDRELRERGLLRRTEGAELLDRRQRLLDQRRRWRATRVLVCGTPVICDNVALSSSKVRRPTSDSGRQIRRRAPRASAPADPVVGWRADPLEGQEEQVVDRALLERR